MRLGESESGLGPRNSIRIRVNDDFTLDAGTSEMVVGARGQELFIRPPVRTMFDQVVDYLTAKPTPNRHRSGSWVGTEGVAAVSVALRWGSYLAVLVDRDKPVSPEGTVGVSRISDDEMARINIEGSAALAGWIDILRTDRAKYLALVDRAVAYLPSLFRSAKSVDGRMMALASREIADQLIEASTPDLLARARATAVRNPTRLLANALLNVAWRNGPVEDVHAGTSWSRSLNQRRITPREERKIIRFANDRLAMGMRVCHRCMLEEPQRPWAEQVLPFGLVPFLHITPHDWTLTENSYGVRFA